MTTTDFILSSSQPPVVRSLAHVELNITATLISTTPTAVSTLTFTVIPGLGQLTVKCSDSNVGTVETRVINTASMIWQSIIIIT